MQAACFNISATANVAIIFADLSQALDESSLKFLDRSIIATAQKKWCRAQSRRGESQLSLSLAGTFEPHHTIITNLKTSARSFRERSRTVINNAASHLRLCRLLGEAVEFVDPRLTVGSLIKEAM